MKILNEIYKSHSWLTWSTFCVRHFLFHSVYEKQILDALCKQDNNCFKNECIQFYYCKMYSYEWRFIIMNFEHICHSQQVQEMYILSSTIAMVKLFRYVELSYPWKQRFSKFLQPAYNQLKKTSVVYLERGILGIVIIQ